MSTPPRSPRHLSPASPAAAAALAVSPAYRLPDHLQRIWNNISLEEKAQRLAYLQPSPRPPEQAERHRARNQRRQRARRRHSFRVASGSETTSPQGLTKTDKFAAARAKGMFDPCAASFGLATADIADLLTPGTFDQAPKLSRLQQQVRQQLRFGTAATTDVLPHAQPKDQPAQSGDTPRGMVDEPLPSSRSLKARRPSKPKDTHAIHHLPDGTPIPTASTISKRGRVTNRPRPVWDGQSSASPVSNPDLRSSPSENGTSKRKTGPPRVPRPPKPLPEDELGRVLYFPGIDKGIRYNMGAPKLPPFRVMKFSWNRQLLADAAVEATGASDRHPDPIEEPPADGPAPHDETADAPAARSTAEANHPQQEEDSRTDGSTKAPPKERADSAVGRRGDEPRQGADGTAPSATYKAEASSTNADSDPQEVVPRAASDDATGRAKTPDATTGSSDTVPPASDSSPPPPTT